MQKETGKSVLVIGGSGEVGAPYVRTLRWLQPDLPITLAARNKPKAEALAAEVGSADVVDVDLLRPDLGLPASAQFAGVAMLLKDPSLNALGYARRADIPSIVSFSDYLTQIGPAVAQYIEDPAGAAMVFLGHFHGGTLSLATIHFARPFAVVESIRISDLIDREQLGGPAGLAENDSAVRLTPHHVALSSGRWHWKPFDEARYTFQAVDGRDIEAEAITLLDFAGLAAATGARAIQLGYALEDSSSKHAGGPPTHEVIIEIAGRREIGGPVEHVRYELIDHDGYSAVSGWGAALVTERMLGRSGGPALRSGLHNPETILDPAYVVHRLEQLGVEIRRA